MAQVESMSWQCPVCRQHTTIRSSDAQNDAVNLYVEHGLEREEAFLLRWNLIRCPNSSCGQYALTVGLHQLSQAKQKPIGYGVQGNSSRPIATHTFLPDVAAPLSEHVPGSVREDYSEAYKIRELSPKASATLSRRALQGMIRDFWQVKGRTLADELSAIEDRCDADLYAAMMALKSVGNIGAHPEKDISVIVDIESGEAEQLLDLLVLLDEEWYLARAATAERIAALKLLGAEKKAAAKPSAEAAPAPPPAA